MNRRSLLAAPLVLAAGTAFAAFPDKPVSITVPFAAGGPTDVTPASLPRACRAISASRWWWRT